MISGFRNKHREDQSGARTNANSRCVGEEVIHISGAPHHGLNELDRGAIAGRCGHQPKQTSRRKYCRRQYNPGEGHHVYGFVGAWRTRYCQGRPERADANGKNGKYGEHKCKRLCFLGGGYGSRRQTRYVPVSLSTRQSVALDTPLPQGDIVRRCGDVTRCYRVGDLAVRLFRVDDETIGERMPKPGRTSAFSRCLVVQTGSAVPMSPDETAWRNSRQAP